LHGNSGTRKSHVLKVCRNSIVGAEEIGMGFVEKIKKGLIVKEAIVRTDSSLAFANSYLNSRARIKL
jgi:hypothetical protein